VRRAHRRLWIFWLVRVMALVERHRVTDVCDP
jgi:hypothetical protein